MQFLRRSVYMCVVFVSLIVSTRFALAQGFGLLGHKEVTINRLLPPTVNLSHKRIRVESRIEANARDAAELPGLLKVKLVTMIQKDPRFILDEVHPETVLKFSITNYYVEEWTVGAGTAQARKAFRGKLEVSYQAVTAATGVALDSENLKQEAGYDPGKTGGLGGIFKGSSSQKAAAEASANETRDQLVDGIVRSMGKRVAPVEEPFVALLPGKALEPLSSLAISHRWGTLEEQADKMDKLIKPGDDSFRIYLIALAKEAQAYDLTKEANERDLGKRPDISEEDATKEFLRAQRYMDEARKLYKDALEQNPKEKDFRPGDTRTEEAVKLYAVIARYKEEYRKAQAAGGATTSGSGANDGQKAIGNSGAKASPLEQILEFCKQGLDAASIKEYIASPDFVDAAKASNYRFNFSTDPLALKEACKANAPAFQTQMRDRLNAAAPATKK